MLAGKKTYIVAALAAGVVFAFSMGYIDESTYQTLLGLLGAGGIATLGAKGNRIEQKVDK